MDQAIVKGKVIISKDFTFEASHVLPLHKGKCSNLHGHSWKLSVGVDGYVSPATGFVVDYADLKQVVQLEVINKVDHQHLGYGDPVILHWPDSGTWSNCFRSPFHSTFYPSSENLVHKFVELLRAPIIALGEKWQSIDLLWLKLNETCTSECEWRRPNAGTD